MTLFSNYEIVAYLKPDGTMPQEVIADNKTHKFEKDRIREFSVAKSIIEYGVTPISSIILAGITIEEFNTINEGLSLIEVNIFFDQAKIYSNTYKIKNSHEVQIDVKGVGSEKSVQLVLESFFMYSVDIDNSFYLLNKVNSPAFTNSSLFTECVTAIKDQYGSVVTGTINNSNPTISTFNNYYFNVEISNFDHLGILINDNKISNNPMIFGIDECYRSFNVNDQSASGVLGTSSDIIVIDLLDSGGIPYVNNTASSFILQEGYKLNTTVAIENYYSTTFLKNILQSKYRYKNTVSGEIYDLPPFNSSTFKMDRNQNDFPTPLYTTNKFINVFEASGNLDMADVQAFRENVLKFSSMRPKIFEISFGEAPLDMFKLGKKIKLNRSGTSITVSADIKFYFSANPGQKIGEVKEEHNHKCSGTLAFMNWVN